MPLPADGDLGADLARIRSALPDDFKIGYSGDWGCSDALLAGANAWYSVVGGILPEPAMQLTRAAQAGDAKEVRRLDGHFQSLWTLFRELGSLRVVYVIAQSLSLTRSAAPRPILPLSVRDQERVAEAVDSLNVIARNTSGGP